MSSETSPRYPLNRGDRRRASKLADVVDDVELRGLVERAAGLSLAKVRAVGVDPPHVPAPRRPPDPVTLSYEALLELLEPYFPGLPLRSRIAVAYERDPRQTSSLTTWALRTAGLRNPCGLLYVRLAELAHGDT